jgi:hypothetical protein
MASPNSSDELFVGRHIDREVIILCVRWCLRFQLNPRSTGRTRQSFPPGHCAFDYHTVGAALRTGVRESLADVCPNSRPVVACRRDIRQDLRGMALAVPCRWPGGHGGRLQADRQA